MNKRILWISAVVVTVLAALSLDVAAQQGQGGGQRGQGGQAGVFAGAGQNVGTLLRNAEVVKLLNITEAQTSELSAAFPQRGAGGGQGGGGQQMTPAERRAQTETQWASVAKVLNAEQLKKFKDIYFQVSVPVARPNAPAGAPTPVMTLNVFVLGAFDLTAEQKEKVNAIADALPRPQQGGDMTAFTAARNKANDDIKALLTDAQKKKMDELTAGAAKVRTDLNLNQPGQGRQGGQGGQGGGRQGGGRGNNN